MTDAGELEALAAVAPAIDEVTGEAAAPAPAPQPEQTAQATAALIAYMTEEIIHSVWPIVHYAEDQRQMFQARLIPVLAKHEGGLPPALSEWAAEIHLMAFIGITGFTTWRQIADHKATAKLARTVLKRDGEESTAAAAEPARSLPGSEWWRQEPGTQTVPSDTASE